MNDHPPRRVGSGLTVARDFEGADSGAAAMSPMRWTSRAGHCLILALALSACALHAALRQGRSPAAWPGRFAAVAWVMMVLSMAWPWTEQWSQRLQGA